MNPLRGILYKLVAVTLFVVMAALIKASAPGIPPGEAVFFRSIVGIPLVVSWLALTRQLKGGIRVGNPWSHVARGLTGTLAMGLNFAAFGLLPLPEVQTIFFLGPVLVVVLAALILGERLRLFRTAAVALGFVGVLIVVWPRLTGTSEATTNAAATLGAVLALAGATAGAFSHVLIRQMAVAERTSAIVFWFLITSALFSLLTLPFGWVVPTLREAVLLLMAGITGGFGQILMTEGYRHAGAAVLAPFEYFAIFVAIALGFFFFDETPTVQMLAGGALVIASGVLIIWREHQLGLKRDRPREASTPPG